MLALLLLVVGVLWLVGATTAAKKVAVFAGALALLWSLVSFGLCRLRCLFASADAPARGEVFWVLAALAGLVLLGAASWLGRDRRKKRLESFRKRNLHPRARALPLPPPDREP
jgi:LPXTG-motif cell wall-anchored protein